MSVYEELDAFRSVRRDSTQEEAREPDRCNGELHGGNETQNIQYLACPHLLYLFTGNNGEHARRVLGRI